MKKNFSIVISLFLLFLVFTSCEQEEQVNSFKSIESEITVDKNAQLSFEPNSLSLDEITDNSCGDPVGKILYAGQHIVVGTVFISNDENNLFVTYDVNDSNWWLKETHLYVGNIDDAPFVSSGNPKIGHFPYHGDHDLCKDFTFTIPLAELDDCFSIISHAVVVQSENGSITSSETAFGYGDNQFDGNRWGWFLDHCKESCENNTDGSDDDGSDDDDDDDGSDDNDSGYEDNDSDQDGYNGGYNSGCMEAYAYNSVGTNAAFCFEDDGFDSWGWTNEIVYSEAYYSFPPVTQSFPIYANADECNLQNGSIIGQLEITITAGDSQATATIAYKINNDLIISDLNLYVGTDPYPLNTNAMQTISSEYFTYSFSDFGPDHSINNISWPLTDVYFIAQASVCPLEVKQ
jgi:hypothetical protein